jgi:thiamine biosynthesis lipoprotein
MSGKTSAQPARANSAGGAGVRNSSSTGLADDTWLPAGSKEDLAELSLGISLRPGPDGTPFEIRVEPRSWELLAQREVEPEPATHRIEFRAMGCQMAAVIESEEFAALERLNQVPAWFETWEGVLSRFRTGSELNRLNDSPGEAVPVSSVLWDVVQVARLAARWSQGMVTPAVLPALEAAGYDRSFEHLDEAPAGLQPQPAGRVPDWRSIEFDPGRRTIRLPHGTRIDLGGVAKGWAASRAANRLAAVGPALVEAGGDIAVSGPRQGGRPWQIAVADPLHPEADIAMMFVLRGGVATSGQDHRRWNRGGVLQHHLIDPRTGAPAATDVLSATVWADSLERAEVAAKVVMLLGAQAGLDWVKRQRNQEALVVLVDGTQIRSHAVDHNRRSN